MRNFPVWWLDRDVILTVQLPRCFTGRVRASSGLTVAIRCDQRPGDVIYISSISVITISDSSRCYSTACFSHSALVKQEILDLTWAPYDLQSRIRQQSIKKYRSCSNLEPTSLQLQKQVQHPSFKKMFPMNSTNMVSGHTGAHLLLPKKANYRR